LNKQCLVLFTKDAVPIVREQDTKAFGSYRTKEDVLAKLAILNA
jgi:hypothetical protein